MAPDELPTEGRITFTGREVGVVLVASAACVGIPDMEGMLRIEGVPSESSQPPSTSGIGIDIEGIELVGMTERACRAREIEGVVEEFTSKLGDPEGLASKLECMYEAEGLAGKLAGRDPSSSPSHVHVQPW